MSFGVVICLCGFGYLVGLLSGILVGFDVLG